MKKTLVQVYALAVCFVAVIAVSVALMMMLYNLVGMAWPDLMRSAWMTEITDKTRHAEYVGRLQTLVLAAVVMAVSLAMLVMHRNLFRCSGREAPLLVSGAPSAISL